MRDLDGGEFGAPRCAGEAEKQQSAIAQAGQDRCQNLTQDLRRGGEFPGGSRPASAAVRCMPAMVSATCASAVGTAHPQMKCRQRMAARRGPTVVTLRPRPRSMARKATTSAARQGSACRSHQAH
jgi:hypothetical protein